MPKRKKVTVTELLTVIKDKGEITLDELRALNVGDVNSGVDTMHKLHALTREEKIERIEDTIWEDMRFPWGTYRAPMKRLYRWKFLSDDGSEVGKQVKVVKNGKITRTRK